MIFAQLGVNSMALPPVLNAGSEELKARVVPDIARGKEFISLAISEPAAGSGIMVIKTTAVKEGDHYVVNGSKKWITGGLLDRWPTSSSAVSRMRAWAIYAVFWRCMHLVPLNYVPERPANFLGGRLSSEKGKE
jgi:hypothetical protein